MPETIKLCYPIVGTRFRPPAQGILNLLPHGAKLELRHEPSNSVDPNAIAVWISTDEFGAAMKEKLISHRVLTADDLALTAEWHLGFLLAAVAAKLRTVGFTGSGATLSFGPEGGPQANFVLKRERD